MFRVFLKWTALFFLIVESLGLIASLLGLFSKLSESNWDMSGKFLTAAPIEVMLRFAIVGLVLSAYLRLRSAAQLPLIVTRQSALLTARAVQSGLLAAIGLYALEVEKIRALAESTPLLSGWIISASAVGTVIVGLILRRRFLSEANDQLRRAPTDVRALGQWQKITILSMVLAMSIGLYGFVLRMAGYARAVEWSFFGGAVLLLFFWRPRLNNATNSPESPLWPKTD